MYGLVFMIDLLKPKKQNDIDVQALVKSVKKQAKFFRCLFCRKETIRKIELSHGKVACCDRCKADFNDVRLKLEGIA